MTAPGARKCSPLHIHCTLLRCKHIRICRYKFRFVFRSA